MNKLLATLIAGTFAVASSAAFAQGAARRRRLRPRIKAPQPRIKILPPKKPRQKKRRKE